MRLSACTEYIAASRWKGSLQYNNKITRVHFFVEAGVPWEIWISETLNEKLGKANGF